MSDMTIFLPIPLRHPADSEAKRSSTHRVSLQIIPAYRLRQRVKALVLARLEAPSRRARLASDCNHLLFRLHQTVLKTLPSQQSGAGRQGWLARAASRRPTSETGSPLAVASRASSSSVGRKNAAAAGSCTCARRGPVAIGLCERSATDQTVCSKTSAGLSLSSVRTSVTRAKYLYSRQGDEALRRYRSLLPVDLRRPWSGRGTKRRHARGLPFAARGVKHPAAMRWPRDRPARAIRAARIELRAIGRDRDLGRCGEDREWL